MESNSKAGGNRPPWKVSSEKYRPDTVSGRYFSDDTFQGGLLPDDVFRTMFFGRCVSDDVWPMLWPVSIIA
jgi:hypothetical protein